MKYAEPYENDLTVANLQWLHGRRKRSRAVRAGALDARLMPAVTILVGLQLDAPAPPRRTRLMRRRTRRGRRGALAFGRWRHEQVSWKCHGRALRRRESALHAGGAVIVPHSLLRFIRLLHAH